MPAFGVYQVSPSQRTRPGGKRKRISASIADDYSTKAHNNRMQSSIQLTAPRSEGHPPTPLPGGIRATVYFSTVKSAGCRMPQSLS